MGKSIYIAEKPSVAQAFAEALSQNGRRYDGYIENDNSIFTWCVGHLVTMSYPEAYDEKLKRWSMETLPFLPNTYKYQIIDSAKKQFMIVSKLLNREDVDTIYVATDSGREGEYIYRLVEQEAKVKGKIRRRVWIDSQTKEEIQRGVNEAKDLSEYDNLAAAAYLRAKEDYLMGINFSRVLTLRYGNDISRCLQVDRTAIAVGRVMTCVLGMVVNREREVRNFVKTPFFRVLGSVNPFLAGDEIDKDGFFDAEWKAVEGSKYFNSPKLYKENGFKKEEDAKLLIDSLNEKADDDGSISVTVEEIAKKTEKKNAPLLFNLAELQNTCSKLFKISPDETLNVIQELYEKKLVTYPRTDARVLSTAIAKEIHKNLRGLTRYPIAAEFANEILTLGTYKNIAKTRYTNDKQITDHYAIIPTGDGLGALNTLSDRSKKVYEVIVHRFLAIFYGPAVYQKMNITLSTGSEKFFAGFKVQTDEGYMKATKYSFADANSKKTSKSENEDEEEQGTNPSLLAALKKLKKGSIINLTELRIKEGETTPPKRYNSGALILAMENAGNLIEDEELREQIKGSGIGTSATRGEILKKLVAKEYLNLNKKTQIMTPTILGEMIYEVVKASIPHLLNPELTASWEKGLNMVANGEVSEDDYMQKLNDYVGRRTSAVKSIINAGNLKGIYNNINQYYNKSK